MLCRLTQTQVSRLILPLGEYEKTQVRAMAAQARAAGLNIDYYPTNFVVQNGVLWYIDYECNAYMDEWSFENWGAKYWTTQETTDAG